MFNFKRDIIYTTMAVIFTILALVIPAVPPLTMWLRRGKLARIVRCRGRKAKRKDFG